MQVTISKENVGSTGYKHISSLLKDKQQSMINELLSLGLNKCSILVRILRGEYLEEDDKLQVQ